MNIIHKVMIIACVTFCTSNSFVLAGQINISDNIFLKKPSADRLSRYKIDKSGIIVDGPAFDNGKIDYSYIMTAKEIFSNFAKSIYFCSTKNTCSEDELIFVKWDKEVIYLFARNRETTEGKNYDKFISPIVEIYEHANIKVLTTEDPKKARIFLFIGNLFLLKYYNKNTIKSKRLNEILNNSVSNNAGGVCYSEPEYSEDGKIELLILAMDINGVKNCSGTIVMRSLGFIGSSQVFSSANNIDIPSKNLSAQDRLFISALYNFGIELGDSYSKVKKVILSILTEIIEGDMN